MAFPAVPREEAAPGGTLPGTLPFAHLLELVALALTFSN